MPATRKDAKTRVLKVQNVSIALKHIKDEGTVLVGCGAEGIKAFLVLSSHNEQILLMAKLSSSWV